MFDKLQTSFNIPFTLPSLGGGDAAGDQQQLPSILSGLGKSFDLLGPLTAIYQMRDSFILALGPGVQTDSTGACIPRILGP